MSSVFSLQSWTKESIAELRNYLSFEDSANQRIPITYPPTQEELIAMPCSNIQEIESNAKAVAINAQEKWGETPLEKRKEIFLNFHDLVFEHLESFLDLIQLETGKARQNALEEVLEVAINSRYYAHRAEGWLESTASKGAVPFFTKTHVHYHPYGLIGIISPWNYPLAIPIADAIPALLAGNAVLLKPSELTPLSALFAKKLLIQAGLPANCLQIVNGYGNDLGDTILHLSDSIAFTGSTATGKIIAEKAGKLLKKCSLELGGKNPLIVTDEVQIDALCEGIIQAAYSNSGQLCVSIEEVYIPTAKYEEIKNALTTAVNNIPQGHSFDYAFKVGALVSPEHTLKVARFIENATTAGAKVLSGGLANSSIPNCTIAPTILEGVKDPMFLRNQECFGPVISLYKYDSIEELISQLNSSEYGLNASVWSTNIEKARQIAHKLKFGTVNINEGYAAAYGSVDAPMGGMRASGIGRRHGKEGFMKYVESSTIAEQRFLPVGESKYLQGKNYQDVMTTAVKSMKHIPGLK